MRTVRTVIKYLPPRLKELFEKHTQLCFFPIIHDYLIGEYNNPNEYLNNINEFSAALSKDQGLNGEEIELLKEIAEINFKILMSGIYSSEKFSIYHPPVHDAAKFLEFLKWYHGREGLEVSKHHGFPFGEVEIFDYRGITPNMIPKAIEWSNHNKIDPKNLSPSQILACQAVNIEATPDKLQYKILISGRIDLLKRNFNDLAFILNPKGMLIWHHATPSLQKAQVIMQEGLLIDTGSGLLGAAQQLWKDEKNESYVIHKNMEQLASPHKNYPFQMIIVFPPLTPEQRTNYYKLQLQRKVADVGVLFSTKLAEPVAVGTDRGVTYFDAVINRKYVIGCIDLSTGKFVKNPFNR